jgi:hypothetical protein
MLGGRIPSRKDCLSKAVTDRHARSEGKLRVLSACIYILIAPTLPLEYVHTFSIHLTFCYVLDYKIKPYCVDILHPMFRAPSQRQIARIPRGGGWQEIGRPFLCFDDEEKYYASHTRP